MNWYRSWFGQTPEYQRRTWGLLGVAAMVWPMMVGATVVEKLGFAYCGWRMNRKRQTELASVPGGTRP